MKTEQKKRRIEDIFYYGLLFVSTFALGYFLVDVKENLGTEIYDYLTPLMLSVGAFSIAVAYIVLYLFFDKKEPINE
ncbi:hypothetical protein [Streptomyces sp. NPDC055607]